MELRQLRYAISVAKERSFTRASRRLNVSQSAVSEQVSRLEQEIGFALFNRTPRGIEPSQRGREFLHEAENVIGEVLSLSETARRLCGAPLETLTLGMGSGMAQMFVPRMFRDLQRKLPGVRLEILTAPTKSIFNDLHEERLDAGIAIESDPERVPAGIVLERLTQADMALIVHPAHRLARARKPIDIGTLASEPIIMSELTVGYGQVVSSLFADLGIRPNVLAVADNIETIKAIVQSGGAVAVVPRACAANEAALGVIKVLAIAPACAVALSLFRRRHPLSRQKESHLAAVRELLKD